MATAKTPKSTPGAAKAAAVPPPAATEAVAAAAPMVERPEPAVEAAAPMAVIEAPVAAPAAAVETPVAIEAPVAAPVAIEAPVEFLPSLAAVVEPVLNGVDELLDFSKANAEAVVAASHSLAVGLQHLAHGLLEWSQDSLEKSVATGKALAGAGSVQDVIELSQSVARHGIDKILEESSKISSLSGKLVEESFAPLRRRVEAVVEKLTKHAA